MSNIANKSLKLRLRNELLEKATLLVLQTLILFLNKTKLCTTTKNFPKCFVLWGYKNIYEDDEFISQALQNVLLTKMYNLIK